MHKFNWNKMHSLIQPSCFEGGDHSIGFVYAKPSILKFLVF